jgi:antitoxin component of MazEF toxin-antitoxin module
MKTRVERIGGELAILVPESMAGELGVGAGSDVRVDVVDGALIVTAERQANDFAHGLFDPAWLHRHESETSDTVQREAW